MPVHNLEDHKQWTHVGFDGRLEFTKPKNVKFVTYSNHLPCIEANAYIHGLILKGVASDTIKTKTSNINQLVRFIENQPSLSSFTQLTDSTFRLFIQSLQAERLPNGERRKQNNTVISVGDTCLEFLYFVQSFHDLNNFIGSDKACSIRTIENSYRRKQEGVRGYIEGIKKSHASFPNPEPKKKRHPISEENALKVWQHVKQHPNKDVRKRDMALYTAMEQTGSRVEELHLIKWSDILEARVTRSLKLTTLKRRDEKVARYVPVSDFFLNSINDYSKVRKKVMKKHKVKHDFLFISLTTGEPFSASSWTTYVLNWRKELGIEERVSPHLWRHAFCTEKLKEFILTDEQINSKDDFRRRLLNTTKLKQQLQQWTGHTQLSSLDVYIDLVFSDIQGYAKVYDAVSLSNTVKLFYRQCDVLKQKIANKEINSGAALSEVEQLLDSFKVDIDESTKSIN